MLAIGQFADPEFQLPYLIQQERSVLRLMAEGLTDQQISDRSGLTKNTVQTYIKRMRKRLGAHTRTKLALWASRDHLPLYRAIHPGGSCQ